MKKNPNTAFIAVGLIAAGAAIWYFLKKRKAAKTIAAPKVGVPPLLARPSAQPSYTPVDQGYDAPYSQSMMLTGTGEAFVKAPDMAGFD